MLPLAGSSLPSSIDSLTQALREGLTREGLSVRAIDAAGPWPALDTLDLDLTGLRLGRSQRLPTAPAPAETAFTAATFSLHAAPAYFEQTPAQLALRATQAEFGFAPTAAAGSVLVLRSAAQGELTVEVAREALEALLHGFAVEAAGKQGVEIKKTRLELNSRGPRELAFRADVTAKMFVVTATVTLSGDVTVDDQLNARLANLRFSGEGMIASAAGGFIRPQLEKLEGRTIPLLAFSLGALKLRDLEVRGGDSLRLSAQFAS